MSGIAHAIDLVLALTLGVGLVGVIALFAIARFSTFKSDAGARHNLWFALLVVLAMIAPALSIATMLISRAEPIVVSPEQAIAIRFPDVSGERVSRRTSAPEISTAPVYEPPRPVKAPFPYADVLVAIWVTGVTVSALRVAAGLMRIRRLVRESRRIGMRRITRGQVLVLEHNRLGVPVAIGHGGPAVLLPQAMLQSANDGDIENIILHELEHLQRFDDVSSLVQSLCMSLMWFNPFAYVVQRRLAAEREMACDEAVVRRIGARHGYASTLWNIALRLSDSRVPNLSAGFAEGSHTVRRVTNLLESTHSRVSRTAFAGVTLALLATFSGFSIGFASGVGSARPLVSDAASVALPDGTQFAAGGRNADGSPVADATITNAGRVVAHASFAVARWAPALTLLRSGDVLMTGGMTPNGATADVEVFHSHSRTFESVGRLRIGRVGHTATLLSDGTVLIAAGERAPGKLESSTEVYDPATRRFSLTADGYGRVSQTAFRIDHGDVLMMGGDPGRGRKNCSIIYSASYHTYHQAGDLVSEGAGRLTFRLPDGTLVTHTID